MVIVVNRVSAPNATSQFLLRSFGLKSRHRGYRDQLLPSRSCHRDATCTSLPRHRLLYSWLVSTREIEDSRFREDAVAMTQTKIIDAFCSAQQLIVAKSTAAPKHLVFLLSEKLSATFTF